jgi:N-acetyl-gamma-glutamyl-phosphate reductase
MNTQKRNAAVLGAGGFVGAELLRLIVTHPHLELAAAVSDSHAGESIGVKLPQLAGLTGLRFQAFSDWSSADLQEGPWTVFAALGHGTSMERLPILLDEVDGHDVQLVDMSGDFRLRNPEEYRRYYGQEHVAADRLPSFVYGLPELHREEIARATRIANPGCFATTSILSLAPAAAAGWPVRFAAVAGMTGSSGAGVQLRPTTHHPRRANNIEAYQTLDHQHLPEITQAWREIGGDDATTISFVPHRTPLVRGIVVSAHLFLDHPVDPAEVVDRYQDFYSDAPSVRLLSRPPAAVEVWGSNRCDLHVTVSDRTIVVSAALDNLVKGAAGQAVQNANLMNGWDETTGLLTPMPAPV